MVTLPAARRLMKATLISTVVPSPLNKVYLFPVLDNVVLLPTSMIIDVIFDRTEVTTSEFEIRILHSDRRIDHF